MDVRMSLWYWLHKDLKDNRSTAEWVRFQRFSPWQTVNLKARRACVLFTIGRTTVVRPTSVRRRRLFSTHVARPRSGYIRRPVSSAGNRHLRPTGLQCRLPVLDPDFRGRAPVPAANRAAVASPRRLPRTRSGGDCSRGGCAAVAGPRGNARPVLCPKNKLPALESMCLGCRLPALETVS